MANNKLLIVIIVIVGVVVAMNYLPKTSTPPATTDTNQANVCQYQPTGQWSAKDQFSSQTLAKTAGTSYYKQDGLQYTASEPTGLNKGIKYSYWLSNTTYFVQPIEVTADCGNNVVVAKAWQNGTTSISLKDSLTGYITTSGAYAIPMGANAQANVQIIVQGTAKKSGAPFGGVMIIERNATLASVTCTGPGISAGLGNFHITNTVTTNGQVADYFRFDNTLDDGSGVPKTITCQFQNGATAMGGGGDLYRVKFFGANYYYTNSGDVVLDVEKYANADTTRTAPTNAMTAWGNWSAS